MSSGITHTGSITLDFKSEKKFEAFGVEWAKCNAHFQVKGEVSKPSKTGKWQYEVPYKLDCGCDTVLGNFNKAYEGAFNKKAATEAPEARLGKYSFNELPLHTMDTSDYLAFMDTCMIPSAVSLIGVDTQFWNISFTNMIRQTNGAAWGNWGLNPSIVPGAVGILDPVTGSFTQTAVFSQGKVLFLKSPQDWVVESSTVHRTETDVAFKGGYKDPSSGTTVDAGLDVSWSFSSEGSIVSNATITGQSQVEDFASAMTDNYAWFLQKAKDAGHATDDGIVQGFGMITVVQNCAGGINIGSQNDNSSFSLVGSVDGINAMTGGGDINAGVKGSYKNTTETKSFESHMWPSETDTAATGEIGISYQFSSFDGKMIMPTWIKPISSFSVTFDNQHGGTYIGHCQVSYDRIINGAKTSYTKKTTVSGGHTDTLDGIPLDAVNMQISIDFEAGGSFNQGFKRPLASLLEGSCTVDMSGVWPWGSHAKIRIPG